MAPGMRPPLQPALRPSPVGAAGALGTPGRSTTLWVGRIASTVEAPFIQQLLEACGKLREWKPVTEPESGKLKGFGFVTYEEPEGVVVALQVLNNLKLDGQELALKCNKATEEYLEWYKRNKQQQQHSKEGGGENGAAPGADGTAAAGDKDAVAENEALGRVMELISQRPAVAGAKVEPTSAAAAADTFLSNLSASRDKAGSERGASSADRKRDREVEREAEREAERERQRQRREEQRREEAAERAYREAVRQWEDHERMRQRELEKERDRAADLLRERQRQVHADNEAADSDDEEEPWRRRPYGGSRRALERRRRRELEQQDDAADRKREEAEAEAAAAAAEAEAKAAANQPAAVPEEPDAGKAAAFGADDSIMAAMLAAVKAKPDPVVAATPAAQPASAIAAPVAKRKVRAAYSEEELKALHEQPDEGEQGGAAGPPVAQPAAAAPPAAVDPAAFKRQLLGLIPKDKAGVFAFQINWAVLDAAPPEVKDKISGWVNKKVAELLAEEPSFCAFIMDQLAAHASAAAMLEALGEVLDEDAASFTTKLWQILIWEQLKLEHGGA
ncbi:hypothetical protein CHLNCDRAFT_135870 [Chlorella variabilis]|uniref:RRM domain-containing protein n=1 Tax=Chlorella variabilis TaxID=554065 RepID=E1ZJ67_CHLVA|nr:hypothetical protein CHLNCDRAFT_135870 [Chlorella variabilis]EFN54448.1 hypothetical protein CHLNCDRAFT_135870 [Chlorella variabilis]|eukprot:XP_005846550.1 hypothetical protein CHLNCDRAFT_135870 [Chlorella variabilis]